MENYRNVETDVLERTLALIAQYEGIINNYDVEKRFNQTIWSLINYLLALIVIHKILWWLVFKSGKKT